MTETVIPEKFSCQMFKIGNSHWGNKALKRCKSIATKDFNGKRFCHNCYIKASNNLNH